MVLLIIKITINGPSLHFTYTYVFTTNEGFYRKLGFCFFNIMRKRETTGNAGKLCYFKENSIKHKNYMLQPDQTVVCECACDGNHLEIE